MIQDKKLLLPEAPNFSRFLEENFKGTVEIRDVREIRQGFRSKRNRLLSSILGKDGFGSMADEDRFYELQRRFPGSKKYFIGPFYQCLRIMMSFVPSEEELTKYRRELREENLGSEGEEEWKRDEADTEGIIANFTSRLKGEFKAYPEFRDSKTGKIPMTYNGFKPGVGDCNKDVVGYISLAFGSYSSLVKLIDNFDNPWEKGIRGHFWKSEEWKRYDGHTEVPFP